MALFKSFAEMIHPHGKVVFNIILLTDTKVVSSIQVC